MVALAGPQCGLGQIGVSELAHPDDRHFHPRVGEDMVLPEVILDGFGDVQETARRHGAGRVGEPPVVVAAQIHVKQIHPRRHEVFHIVERHLDCPAVLELFEIGHLHGIAIGFI